jgi:hypothetical protein
MASSSSGYVALPPCPTKFDGTNYADFAGYMCVHMRDLRLWDVLCGEVPCLVRPLVQVAPVPPTLSVITADAFDDDRVAAKTADDASVGAYDQQVADFSEDLSTYRDALLILTLVEKRLLVAHQFELCVAHMGCATIATPLVRIYQWRISKCATHHIAICATSIAFENSKNSKKIKNRKNQFFF